VVQPSPALFVQLVYEQNQAAQLSEPDQVRSKDMLERHASLRHFQRGVAGLGCEWIGWALLDSNPPPDPSLLFLPVVLVVRQRQKQV
jgi:hypothetical protein